MSVPIRTYRAAQRLINAAWRRIAQSPESLARRDDFQPCYICGRPVDTKSSRTRWLRVIDGGGTAAEDGDTIDPAGDLLWHPVGADCFKGQPELRSASKGQP